MGQNAKEMFVLPSYVCHHRSVQIAVDLSPLEDMLTWLIQSGFHR